MSQCSTFGSFDDVKAVVMCLDMLRADHKIVLVHAELVEFVDHVIVIYDARQDLKVRI